MDIQLILQAYLDDEISEAQHRALMDWLAADESHREEFARQSILDNQIRRSLMRADLTQFMGEVDLLADGEPIALSPSDRSVMFMDAMVGLQQGSGPTGKRPAGGRDDRFLSLVAALEDKDNQATPVQMTRREPDVEGLRITPRHAVVARLVGVWGTVSRPAVLMGVAAAAALLAMLVLMIPGNTDQPTSPLVQQPAEQVVEPDAPRPVFDIAQLASAFNSQWAGEAPRTGQPLAPGRYELVSGEALFRMTSGAEALIKGPARFELTGTNQVTLDAGTLIAQVPQEAIGFTVITSSARIIDVGTEFAVHVAEDRRVQLQVHQGAVRAAAIQSDGETAGYSLIRERRAIDFVAGAPPREAAYQPGNFKDSLLEARKEAGTNVVTDPTLASGPGNMIDPDGGEGIDKSHGTAQEKIEARADLRVLQDFTGFEAAGADGETALNIVSFTNAAYPAIQFEFSNSTAWAGGGRTGKKYATSGESHLHIRNAPPGNNQSVLTIRFGTWAGDKFTADKTVRAAAFTLTNIYKKKTGHVTFLDAAGNEIGRALRFDSEDSLDGYGNHLDLYFGWDADAENTNAIAAIRIMFDDSETAYSSGFDDLAFTIAPGQP